MAIQRSCENCANDEYCTHIQHQEWTCYCNHGDFFVPKEETIRQDEIKRTIQLIENIKNSKVDLKKFNYKEFCDLIILELKMSLLEMR